MNKIFITGASGFIGEKLVSAIDTKKNTLRALSRSKIPGIETVICNLQSEKISKDALKGVDIVFHLAGIAHDSSKQQDQQEDKYIAVNYRASEKLAELAVVSGVKKFIFLSSVKAGGNMLTGECMAESDEFEPEGIYGKTKRKAELKLLRIGSQSEMHVSIIRSALVYGPSMKGNLGAMLSGIEKGWFPSLPKISNQRSLVHIDDLVKAILLVAKDDRANGEIFIVTDGVPYSSREIYEVMRKILGKSIPKLYLPKFCFNLIAFFSLSFRYKVKKLFEDSYYSSRKINSIGFKPQRSLREMNETSF
jgi:nucleoside-diphosphate-sugar epimerase